MVLRYLQLLALSAAVKAYEVIGVDRFLDKGGLHRHMITEATFRMDDFEEFQNCKIVFREVVTKDAYVYLEELEKLKGFEFYQDGGAMDIERPARVSKDQVLVWALPFEKAIEQNDYVMYKKFLTPQL